MPTSFADLELATVLTRLDGAVAWVVLNRPDSHNAFDEQLTDELELAWTTIRDDSTVRSVVLTASGDKAFCTGIDRNWDVPQPADPTKINDPGLRLSPKAAGLLKPVVAAVNGMACGGAFYLLGEVETIVAAETATFFDPHTTYGMTAAFEPILLVGQLPFGELARIALMGNHERMTAQRAHQIGFVQDIVPLDELHATAGRIAHAIASQPAAAVEGTVRALWAGREKSRSEALALAPQLIIDGNRPESVAEGHAIFASGKRTDPNLR